KRSHTHSNVNAGVFQNGTLRHKQTLRRVNSPKENMAIDQVLGHSLLFSKSFAISASAIARAVTSMKRWFDAPSLRFFRRFGFASATRRATGLSFLAMTIS